MNFMKIKIATLIALTTVLLGFLGSTNNTVLASQLNEPEANFHVVLKDDTLWGIATKYYGFNNGHLWRNIYEINNLSFYNGFPLIHAGNKLTIPSISKIESKEIKITNHQKINLSSPIRLDTEITEQENTLIAQNILTQNYLGVYNRYLGSFCKTGEVSGTHTSECTNNSNGSYSYRALIKDNGSEYMYAVHDGAKSVKYDFLNQITYHPSLNKTAYRARIDDLWYVIYDNKKSQAFKYIEGIFFTNDGMLFAWTVEDKKHSLIQIALDENNATIKSKTIASSDYIDNFLSINDSDLVYRQKNKINGQDKWNFVLKEKQLAQWNYVDLPFYHQNSKSFFYRARDDQGRWHIVKVDNNKNEEEIFNLDSNKEITNYFVNPTNSKQVIFILSQKRNSKNGWETEYVNNGLFNDCRYIDQVGFSKNSQHYAYQCLRGYEYYLIIDDKLSIKIDQSNLFDIPSDDILPQAKYGFDNQGRFVVYGYKSKDVYTLDN